MQAEAPEKFQVRVTLSEAFARAARETPHAPVLAPVNDVLRRNDAGLRCQFHEFRSFVDAAEAHEGGDGPLLRWTKAVMDNPHKREKYEKAFVVLVKGEQLFSAQTADALEDGLQPLVEAGIVTDVKRISTDRTKNPQPPARFR